MSAYGIAGLVDGFFKGREIRNSWDDRKDTKARQAKLDEFYAAEQARIAERHAWARDDQGRKVSDYERARADDEAFRLANEQAIAATEAAMSEEQQPAVTTSTMGAPPRPEAKPEDAAQLPDVIDAVTRKSAAADQFERFFDPNDLGASKPRVAEGTPAAPRRADAPLTDTRREAIDEARAVAPPRTIQDLRAEAAAVAQNDTRLKTLPDGTRVAPAPSAAIADELGAVRGGPQGVRYLTPEQQPADPMAGFDREQMSADMAARLERDKPNYQHDWFNKGLGPDAREVVNRAAAALGAAPRAAVNAAVDLNNAAVDLARPAVKYMTGGEDGFTIPYTPRLPDPQRPAASAAQAAPAPAQPAAPAPAPAQRPAAQNVPANAPPATKQLAAVADQAMGQASTPAIKATAAAVAKEDPGLGASGNRPFTEKQRERASASFMERYMEVGAPIVIKEYLRRGEIDKAKAFQEFLDQDATKAGMRNWARASFAASVGDFDSFASEIMEGYNRLDYFGDDTTIVTSESGFTDASGNITKDNSQIAGAKIVFRDEISGKTFEQVYDSPEDIVTMGVTLLAPEEAFEYYVKKTEAAKEAALGAAKADLEKAEKAAESRAKAVEKAAEVIFKAAKESINPEDQAMTWEEAVAQAEASVPGGGPRRADADPLGAPPQSPPVMYRP